MLSGTNFDIFLLDRVILLSYRSVILLTYRTVCYLYKKSLLLLGIWYFDELKTLAGIITVSGLF